MSSNGPCKPMSLYCDGGIIGRNPSAIGGTWAWCLVEGDQLVREKSGLIIGPAGVRHSSDHSVAQPVSNNLAELVAAILGIEALPMNWSGYVCSDSQVTIGRLFWMWKFTRIPQEWIWRAGSCCLLRPGPIRPILLQGHPTKTDLACGIGKRRNLPVSKWNVYCHQQCSDQAAQYYERSNRAKDS